MVSNNKNQAHDQLALRSRLSEITYIPEWIESLAVRYRISAKMQFAIDLCLEETISNIIRHGYAGAEDRSLTVTFTLIEEGYFRFAVDDVAPLFNPLVAPELPPLSPSEDSRIGGQGIRFLRQFSDALEYEVTPTGNRLIMFFREVRSASQPESSPHAETA